MKKRICEVCDILLMPDYKFDVCSECCDSLRRAMAEPATRIIEDPDGPFVADIESDKIS